MIFKGPMRNLDYIDYLERTKDNVQVSIELASHCNFHCYYCQHPKLKREKGYISDKMFYHLAEQLPEAAHGGAVGVNWAGESTLHSKFYEFTSYLNKMGLKIALPTNGSTLSNRMFDIDFAWIQVYLDKNASDFSRRSKLNYEDHINRILNFTKEWLRNSSTVRLRYWVQKTKSDLEGSANLLAKYDFIKSFVKQLGLSDSVALDFSNRVICEFRKSNGGILQIGQMPIISGGIFPVTDDNSAPEFDHPNRQLGFCDSAWKHTKVTIDGRLTLCCQALEGKTIFSKSEDIWKKSITDIWLHDSEVVKFREHMKRGELLYDVCRQCLDVFPTRELYHPHHLVYEKSAGSYNLGSEIDFGSEGNGNLYTGSGFAPPTNLTWSMAPHAWLHLILDHGFQGASLKMSFYAVTRIAADGSDRKEFDIVINGIPVNTYDIHHQELHQYDVVIDTNLIPCDEEGRLDIQFIVSERSQFYLPTSHANLPRVGLQKMTIVSV